MPSWWNAAKHVADGSPIYSETKYTSAGIFTYPPIFAQLLLPINLLPAHLSDWIWRLSSLLCLRYLVGSWKATLVSFAFIPVLIELSINNVTFQLAAALLFAFRDRRGSYLLPWLVALKFGPLLAVPYLWWRRPDSRRPLLIGSVVFAMACAISYVISPSSWAGYIHMMIFQSAANLNGTGVIHLLPSGGGADFLLRIALAGVVAMVATFYNRASLVYAAAVITCPVFAISRLAPLVALVRFRKSPEVKAADDTAPEIAS